MVRRVASLKTTAKRLDERRTWTVTWIDRASGEFKRAAYNLVVANTKARRVKLPGKKQREAARKVRGQSKAGVLIDERGFGPEPQ